MFDSNTMKKNVKEWMKAHPTGSEKDLQDYCEAMIPPQQYQGHKWLVDQTLAWYRYILENRRKNNATEDDDADEGLE